MSKKILALILGVFLCDQCAHSQVIKRISRVSHNLGEVRPVPMVRGKEMHTSITLPCKIKEVFPNQSKEFTVSFSNVEPKRIFLTLKSKTSKTSTIQVFCEKATIHFDLIANDDINTDSLIIDTLYGSPLYVEDQPIQTEATHTKGEKSESDEFFHFSIDEHFKKEKKK